MRRRWGGILVLICTLLLGIGCVLIASRYSPGRYVVPLHGNFVLEHFTADDSDNVRYGGPFVLAHMSPQTQAEDELLGIYSGEALFKADRISHVQKIAITNNQIVGLAGGKYFIDTIKGARIEWFDSRNNFMAALRAKSIAGLKLASPATLSINVPAQQLRPWAYAKLGG